MSFNVLLWLYSSSRLNPVSLHSLLELLRKRGEIDSRFFELARARGGLLAGLSDVAHGLHHLSEADRLLVRAGDNLLERLHALLDVCGHLANRAVRYLGLLFARIDPFNGFLGQHDRSVDAFLDGTQNR